MTVEMALLRPYLYSSLYYSFTHAHRSIGYHNIIPQSQAESTVRLMYQIMLMYLRVYDSEKIDLYLVTVTR